MDLDGAVAVVTGGAVRLGRALALSLAAQGARIAIHYNSSAGAAEAMVSEIEHLGGNEAIAVQADLSQAHGAPKVIRQAAEHFGAVDVLVNSAAIFLGGDWQHTTEDNWDRHFAINLKAPFFLSQAFAAHIGGSRRGHIVNIADWRGAHPGADHIAYTLSKAGLIAMTKSLAQALAPEIQVNAIAPGLILPPPGEDRAYLEAMATTIPAQRVGSPDEVGKALVFLLQSDFVTGDVVYVTGGQHLGG
jgi:NAD(P)-dependent dehydrogenase (short-subunit alcohol dehydrogenase family)